MINADKIVDIFSIIMNKYNFFEASSDDYMVTFGSGTVKVQLFFGRYSDQADIFIRYEDGDKPEMFSVASMLFISEVEKGMKSSLKDADENIRLNRIVNYFSKNIDTVLSKTECRDYKKRVDEYIKTNY